jgi:phosphoglycerate kinase
MAGLKGIKTIRDFELKDKRVFLRLDLNVPLEEGKIADETRIQASLPTIKYALEQGAKLILASHLGRPKGPGDKANSLELVGRRLAELLNVEVMLVEEPDSEATKGLLSGLKKNQLILLENVRFHAGETKDAMEFAQVLAPLADIYINDAFGASHRAHATIHALPSLMKEKGIGFLIEKEVKMLDQLLEAPKRPYIAVLGGAKVSDKIAVIEKLIDLVDGFVIGGAMAYTFLKAKNISVGKSLVETEKLNYAREMIARMETREKILMLPVDHIVASEFAATSGETTVGSTIPDDKMGLDIGPQSLRNFSEVVKGAATIFWNGPMGVFEKTAFSRGTFGLAKAIAESKAMKIIGGGDSAAAAEQSGFADQMTHISTGGGASLEYLQGDKLPGLEVLRTKIRPS